MKRVFNGDDDLAFRYLPVITAFVLISGLLVVTTNARAGFPYVLRQQDGAANQIYGYSVNDNPATGADGDRPIANAYVPSTSV